MFSYYGIPNASRTIIDLNSLPTKHRRPVGPHHPRQLSPLQDHLGPNSLGSYSGPLNHKGSKESPVPSIFFSFCQLINVNWCETTILCWLQKEFLISTHNWRCKNVESSCSYSHFSSLWLNFVIIFRLY